MPHRYYSILRPIALGTFPSGKKVLKIHNFDCRTPILSINRMAWGYIEFEDPLTDEEAERYDLIKYEETNIQRYV